ncbi:MAG TPA: TonB-dependent receptor [Candidatus Acidoferrum sp.]|nr:TonB-dependent receptor [Candidatus Acidoferrum sp.]
MQMHRLKGIVFIVAMVLVGALRTPGQTATTGQILGEVTDPSGGVVGGAKVTLTSDAGTQRDTMTSGAGHYAFSVLPPGKYRLEISASGFAMEKIDEVTVKITGTTNVDIRLKLATQKQETITVQAEPPLVQTDNPGRGTVIEQTEIRQLPLPTRNFQQLLTLTPGTSGPVQNSSELGRGAAPIYVNGLRATSNSVIINGTDANSIGTGSTPNLAVPATDTLQEFIVQTSQYDASQGRVAGGIVAAVTKSGTNEFHGNAYEFFRNTVLDANNFFLNAAKVSRPPYNRNQFGGTFGGPILKDRLWFFVSYQGSRERNSTSLTNSIGTVFVPQNLSNDRSTAGVDAVAASYGLAPCATPPNGFTLVPCFDPTAQYLLQAKLPNGSYVIPSAPNPTAPAIGQVPSPVAVPVVAASKFREDQFNTNLDYQLSAANRISAKFFAANNPATQGLFDLFGLANALPVPGFGGTANLNQRVFALDDTHLISSRLVNDAHFGFGFISTGSKPQEPFTATQVGISSPLGNLFPGMPEISVPNYFDLGANPFSDNGGVEKTYTVGDTLSWQKGRHSLKFGVEYKHHDLNETFNLYTRGQIIYLGATGNTFEDFLGGSYDLTGLTIMGSGVNNRDNRAHDLGGFVNDDWKVSDRLTFTLGLRYDYFGPFTEAQGRYVGFDPTKIQTAAIPGVGVAITGGFVQASNAKIPLPGIPLVQSSLVPPDKNNFAPRVGFAWQPFSNTKRLVVRGGYGVYYDRANSRLLNNQVLNFPYYTLAQAFFTPIATPFVNVPQPSSYPLTFNSPAFPFGGPPAIMTQAPTFLNPTGAAVVSANGIYPDIHDFRTPYIQQFSLGIQNEFAHNWMLDVSYVGSIGRKLYQLRDLNQAVVQVSGIPVGAYYPGLSSLAVQGFGVHVLQSSANSSYNSLQMGLTKRFSNGLQFLASYTYSHSLDDYSGDVTGTSDISVVPGNETILNNHASSDFDRRHRFVFSGIYDLPEFYKGESRFAKQAANGWELASVFTLQSGVPFSVLTNDNAFVQARADAVAGCNPDVSGSVESRLGKYFNTACFIPAPATAAGGFGDTGRNILRGPNQRNVDISIIKYFPITERTKLEFRSEFFNAFNMVSFANPVNTLASANNGQIVSTTTGPRVIQFALKFNF